MIRVTFADGTVYNYRDKEVIQIENYPPRTTPKQGWERTREYPPEYRRSSPLGINVLSVGRSVDLSQGFIKVTKIEHLPDE